MCRLSCSKVFIVPSQLRGCSERRSCYRRPARPLSHALGAGRTTVRETPCASALHSPPHPRRDTMSDPARKDLWLFGFPIAHRCVPRSVSGAATEACVPPKRIPRVPQHDSHVAKRPSPLQAARYRTSGLPELPVPLLDPVADVRRRGRHDAAESDGHERRG